MANERLQKFNNLPDSVKDLLTSTQEAEMLEMICEKYKIENNFREIQKNIAALLYKDISFVDFKRNIIAIVGDSAGGNLIVDEIDQQILAPVKTYLNSDQATPITNDQIKDTIVQAIVKRKAAKVAEQKSDSYREPIE